MKYILHKQKKDKGFTLVELIVTIVILAILAAILVPALLGYIDRARDQKYILMAESVERAIQSTYSETYAKGYEILNCRSNFRANGIDHYNDIMFFHNNATNKSEICKDANVKKAIVDNIAKLSDLGDYKLVYIGFSFDHSTHQIYDNKARPGVAGQNEDTNIKIQKKGSTDTITLVLDNATGWSVKK